jgi:hypothetical protein
MAKNVGVYAVLHTPSFVEEVRLKEAEEPTQFFSIVRSELKPTKADVIVTINNDHFNTLALQSAQVVRSTPVWGEPVRPQRLPAIAAFLTSDRNGFVTGDTIDASGGADSFT